MTPNMLQNGTRAFYSGGPAQVETYARLRQKFLAPSAFPNWKSQAPCNKQVKA